MNDLIVQYVVSSIARLIGIVVLSLSLAGVAGWLLSACVQEPGRQPPVECKCPKCEAKK